MPFKKDKKYMAKRVHHIPELKKETERHSGPLYLDGKLEDYREADAKKFGYIGGGHVLVDKEGNIKAKGGFNKAERRKLRAKGIDPGFRGKLKLR